MIAIVMMAGLFTWENIEFFNTSRQQMSEGYEWEYIGKSNTVGVPDLPLINPRTDEETIYFKLK